MGLLLVLLLLSACDQERQVEIEPRAPSSDAETGHDAVDGAIRDYQMSMSAFLSVKDAPPVTVVNTVEPEDITRLVQACMDDMVWSMTNGSYEVPKEQDESFRLAEYECSAKYPPDPRLTGPLTVDQKNYFYDYVMNQEIPCIESFGFDIIGIPSRETFIATFDANQWFPFSQLLPELTPSEWDQVYAACPQSPRSVDLYAH